MTLATPLPGLPPPGGLVNATPETYRHELMLRNEAKLQGVERGWFEASAYAIPGTVLAAADTFLESFGILDDQDMEKFVQQNMGQLGQYFNDNRAPLGMVGDIGGAFIPGMLGVKAVQQGSMLSRLATKALGKNADHLFSTGKTNKALFEPHFQRVRSLVDSKVDVANLHRIPGFEAARSRAIGRSVADIFIEGAGAEAAIATTMHSSDFLFPEDMSLADHLFFFAGTNTAFAAAGGLIARNTFVRGVNAEMRRATRGSGVGVPVDELVGNVANMQGPKLGVLGDLLNAQKRQLTEFTATGDATAREITMDQMTATREAIKESAVRAFQDSPRPGITHSVRNADQTAGPEIRTIQAAIERDPSLGANLRSFELWDAPDAVPIERRHAAAMASLDADLKLADAEFQLARDKVQDIIDRGLMPTQAQEVMLEKARRKVAEQQEIWEQMSREVPIAVELDGTTRPLAGRAPMFQDGPRQISMDKFGHAVVKTDRTLILARKDGQVFLQDPKKLDFDIDPQTGELRAGPDAAARELTDAEWLKLPHYERTAVLDTLRKQLDTAKPGSEFAQQLMQRFRGLDPTELETMSFTQLDYAIETFRALGFTPAAFPDLDRLVYESVRKKFNVFQQIQDDIVDALTAGVPSKDIDYAGAVGMENLVRALNLPADNHALIRFFETQGMRDGLGAVDLKVLAGDMNELRHALASVDEFADPVKAHHEIMGEMLRLSEERRPLVGYMSNNDNRAGIRTEDLIHMMGQMRAKQAEAFRTSDSRFVQRLFAAVDNNAEAIKAAKAEMRAVVAGNEQDGAFMRNIVQQNYRFRNTPGASAFDFVTDLMDRMGDNELARILNPAKYGEKGTPHQDRFNRLLSRGNETDLTAFMSAYTALAKGWIVDAADSWLPVTGKNGEQMYQLRMADMAANRALVSGFPDRTWDDFGGLVPSPTGGPLVLTEAGKEAVESFGELHDEILRAVNTDRRARGLKPIERRQFHMPAPAFGEKHVGFLVGMDGKVRQVVGANSEAEMLRRADQEKALASEPLSLLTDATMERYHSAWAEAYFAMTDFSQTARQSGPRTGRGVGRTVDDSPDAFKTLLETTLKQFSDVGRQIRTTVFSPEIDYLKRMKAATGERAADGTLKQTRTIFDEMISRITGAQNLDANSVVGRHLLNAETTYDRLVQGAWDKILQVSGGSGRGLAQAERRIKALEDRFLPEHRPFKSVEDYMQGTFRDGMPVDLRRHAAALNEITTGLTIRVLDFGMGLINVASLAATLPPVVHMLRRMPGEAEAEYMSRIGAFGSITPGGNGYFSSAKAVASALHLYFSPEGKRIAQKASRDGWFDQFAAEQVEIWGRTGQSFLTGMIRNASDKLSFITDKSERFARGASWFTFYNIGRQGLGLTEDAAMAFAHRQANNVIADFRPSNRPAIFQGAAGMPLGLFTTYMWNYFHRLTYMVENKAMRAGAIQAGLQASLFGGESLPGWSQYNEWFMTNYDGSYNVVDRLNESMGPMAADLFLNGSVSNLPKLMGFDDGVSIGPRASVGVPFEHGFGPQAAAGVKMIVKAGQTVGRLIDSAIENHGVDPQQAAAILASANMNKFLSNAIELGLGYSVDTQNSLLEENTRSTIGIASRTLGFKPLATDEMRQESVRHRTHERIQQQLKARLSDAMVADMRNGKLSAEAVERHLASYVRAGGTDFKSFLATQALKAQLSTRDRALLDSLTGSIDEGRIGRLLWLDRD